MGHRKTITSAFRHMRTSILVEENEEKFSFLIHVYCVSEVSGTCGMCVAFCVHPMCSNYETLLADYTWKTSRVTSSMQVKYKSATWANVWGASKSSTSTRLTSRVFQYIVTWTQLWPIVFPPFDRFKIEFKKINIYMHQHRLWCRVKSLIQIQYRTWPFELTD